MLTSLRKNFTNIDSISAVGFFLSIACAIHCMALPIIVLIAPLTGIAFFENEMLEHFTLASSILIASFSLYSSYKSHRSSQILYLFGAAISLLVFGIFLPDTVKPWIDAIGAICIAITLFWNYKLTHIHGEDCNH